MAFFKNNIFWLLLSWILIISFFTFSYSASINKRVYFVDIDIVFREFNMTKDAEKNANKKLNYLQFQLDSIKKSAAVLENKNQQEKYVSQIIAKQNEIENFNLTFNELEIQKIQNRIGSYTDEYRTLKNYNSIIGISKKNNILSTDIGNDITKDLIKYLNKRYEGFN